MNIYTIDGNINYSFSFSITDENISADYLRQKLSHTFDYVVCDDNPEGEKFLTDVKTCQDFLHGDGLPFSCRRIIIKNYIVNFKSYDIHDSCVYITLFPDSQVMQVCVCLSIKNCPPDDMVYMRHVQGNGALLTCCDGREMSVYDIFSQCLNDAGIKAHDVEQTYLLEIKRLGAAESVREIIDNHGQLLYGMMTGDEGYRNVPEDVAVKRLENSWGSRDFIHLSSFGSNTLFINLNDSALARDYRARRAAFDAAFYGSKSEYFLMDSTVAGVNHGVIFALEMVLVVKTICNRILRRQAEYYKKNRGSLQKDIRKTKKYRGELLLTLKKVENLGISEIGEMEKVMLNSQQIEPLIEKIRYLLELLDSELNLLYQTSTNRLVNILTVAGLIIAVLQLITS